METPSARRDTQSTVSKTGERRNTVMISEGVDQVLLQQREEFKQREEKYVKTLKDLRSQVEERRAIYNQLQEDLKKKQEGIHSFSYVQNDKLREDLQLLNSEVKAKEHLAETYKKQAEEFELPLLAMRQKEGFDKLLSIRLHTKDMEEKAEELQKEIEHYYSFDRF